MKTRFPRKTLCILFSLLLIAAAALPAFAGTRAEDAHLHFDADGKFRILNFSDIQDNESLDSRVKEFIPRAVYAAQPDLIVLTGDNIYGTKISSSKTRTAIAEFMDIFESLGVPVAIVFGNHDDEGGTSKEAQMQMYNSYSVSISHDEGSSMDGCGTYNVPIYGSTETEKVKFNLWMFDTGSNASSGYDHMRTNQLDWYVSKSNQLKAANGGALVPSIAFQHIIVKEIFSALKQVSSGGVTYNGKHYVLPDNAAPGSVLNEHPCPSDKSTETEFARLRQQGDVLAIVCGHDHVNQFIVPYQGIDLINTPGTGFYSYGDENVRGARIIDLDEQTGAYTTRMLYLRDLAQPEYSVRADTGGKYVRNIALCVAQTAQYGSVEAAKTAAYNRLLTAVDAANGNGVVQREDMNGGSTNDKSSSNHYVVCMGYSFTRDPAEAMRGLGLCYTGSAGASGAQYDGANANGLVWNLCNTNALTVSGTDGAADLNAGTSGSAIYFVANYGSSGSPLTEIRIVNTGSDAINLSDYSDYHLTPAVVGSNTGTSYADLNKSAKGDYVYALYRTAADGAARILLDSGPLRAVRLRAARMLKYPDTVYTEESMTALRGAIAQADEILHDLDDDRQTQIYDQSALDQAAARITACAQDLTTPFFTVTFDAAGGACAEQTRSIRYGAVCGTLPTAQRNRFVLKGWYTEPNGCGERIEANTVYSAASDQTWYAYWINDPHWLAGDADGSSSVNLQDVVLLQRYLAGGWGAQVDFDHADVNADGSLDLRDVMLLRRFLAGGWNVELV